MRLQLLIFRRATRLRVRLQLLTLRRAARLCLLASFRHAVRLRPLPLRRGRGHGC
ncbi:hypothetical protein [Streptomyces sp. NPDC048428]|uniref:hypothetical protein n=1 Tax=Streptomyces sp. NPDC048428 TaxID=3154503 RepID=UPI0034153310